VALAGEGPLAFGGEGLLPAPQQAVAEVEVACDLGDAAALLGDELDGLDLELGCERSSRLRHRWSPHGELTPLSGRSPSVGKSSQRVRIHRVDMGSAYPAACAARLNHSRAVTDRFHVAKKFNEVVDALRKN